LEARASVEGQIRTKILLRWAAAFSPIKVLNFHSAHNHLHFCLRLADFQSAKFSHIQYAASEGFGHPSICSVHDQLSLNGTIKPAAFFLCPILR
jgi:hypothetical protein